MALTTSILPNEKELFIRLSRGDQVAFTKIFDHYEPRIYPFVLKMTRSEISAEEIVQELFIKIWTNRAIFENIENPRSYIYRMATNKTVNYMKAIARNVRLVKKVSGQLVVEKNITEELLDLKETEAIINQVVGQLPEQQRKVYILSRKEGLKAEEIAERLNISHKTVKNHLTEALHFIKEKLQRSPGTAIALIIFLIKNSR
jgi:RNA polymerase sigma-70 factor (ECF subfamily)